MGVNVRRLVNTDNDFYPTMGPFLARREVERDLGHPIYDDDDRVWWVALHGDRVVGFCAARPGSVSRYVSDYVVPDQRGRGVFSRLWVARESEVRGPAAATVTAAGLPIYQKHGFSQVRTRGRYTEVRRD